jgi:hypothetical protein
MIAYSAGVAVADVGPFREQGNFWRSGAWQQGWFNYFIDDVQTHWPQLPPGLSDEERQRASAALSIDKNRIARLVISSLPRSTGKVCPSRPRAGRFPLTSYNALNMLRTSVARTSPHLSDSHT